ncbi:hypothetical protein NPIL_457201 [Nephila pilipes]|uniref:Uncharacterized protein n=1 Tax=Nephila pilipes TaxID=299642 RepID=A0A8X6PEJ1_NEPPI|nr:hypothetical protein NPIL_457201 [Nephila pilipes]
MIDKRLSNMGLCKLCIASERYERIIELMEFFDSTMSFTAFCLNLLQFICMLYFLITLQDLDKSSAPKHVFSATIGLIGFLSLSISASDVNEADKMAKRTNCKLYKQEWKLHKQKCSSEWIPPHFTEQAFQLSGWGFFVFTRNFILSTFGSLLTFSLLLLQLDDSLVPSQMDTMAKNNSNAIHPLL